MQGVWPLITTFRLRLNLQIYRAVDNQVFFSMCSPARDLTAGYHAVSFHGIIPRRRPSPLDIPVGTFIGHRPYVRSLSLVREQPLMICTTHRGSKLVEAEDGETILHTRIGE